jgi:hypothetical protein
LTPQEFKAAQKRLGYNNIEMADKLGVTPRMVVNYRMGHNPVTPMAAQLITALLAAVSASDSAKASKRAANSSTLSRQKKAIQRGG